MDNITSIWSGTITGPWDLLLASYNLNYRAPWGAELPYPQYNQSGTPVTPTLLAAYTKQWATLNPSGTPLSKYTTTPPAPSCPTSLPGKAFNTNAPLPTLGVAKKEGKVIKSDQYGEQWNCGGL
jgi:hypothetical protein